MQRLVEQHVKTSLLDTRSYFYAIHTRHLGPGRPHRGLSYREDRNAWTSQDETAIFAKAQKRESTEKQSHGDERKSSNIQVMAS